MRQSQYTWKIFYKRFNPAQEGLRESLFTLGNGYMGTRGAECECVASGIHYPGTYISGLYNRLRSHIAGKTIVSEDFVNCPNWTFLTFKIGDGEWFSPSTTKILDYYKELDTQRGILGRKVIFQNWKGQKTLIETFRIVHMVNPHLGAIKYVITPQNYSEQITVRTMLDGSVCNTGVERYRNLNYQHLKSHNSGYHGRNIMYLSVVTSQLKVKICEVARVNIFSKGKPVVVRRKRFTRNKKVIGEDLEFSASKNKSYQVEKIVSLYTSQDREVKNAASAAIHSVKTSGCFDTLLKTHTNAWVKLWKKVDVEVKGSSFSQKVLRLYMFHLLQTGSVHSCGRDVGLPARGLHGEAYRGHIFWDSIFAMPFYDFHFPEVSKSFLMYRYRRLEAARQYAHKEGYRGAMFPWQSGSSGKEETQVIHLNPLSGKWGADYSRFQRHVSFAIAYNVWHYWKIAGDSDFLIRFAAELILSIAQFGASLAHYNTKDGRFHTTKAMGPDEFHEKYPHLSTPGLRDNAYTNFMIVWTILKAKEIICVLPHQQRMHLLKKLGIDSKELKRWDEITKKMIIIFNRSGIVSQFDGYFQLKELDWDKYRAQHKNIQRMDRILKAEGRSPDDYKVSKQADVLMIFYLLPLGEIKKIFKELGYHFDKNMLKKNYEYYSKRTTHGSTLSKVAQCIVAHRLGSHQEAWQLFQDVLESDFYDSQGGTTPEGIHVGVMGGALDILMRGFLGIHLRGERIRIEPTLPKAWRRLKVTFCYRGNWLSLTLTRNKVVILVQECQKGAVPFTIQVNGELFFPFLGKPIKVTLKR
ncbi:MAG: glycoside hydrolase family 65 protein [Candidatus Omnitrophota bacterium]|nr:MAG: glycoside hydrolase family 65 protein [Candidatus Omnitrophota bacterium]